MTNSEIALPEPVIGGKALSRLLETLGQRGLTSLAESKITSAIPDELVAPLISSMERFSAAIATEIDATGSPFDALAQEYLSIGQRLGPPTGTGPQWRSLGPATIPNGQTYGSSRVNVSGRISAIAIDPRNVKHVLAGAANGGVWESSDHGATWSSRTDWAATTAVGAITFDPNNSSIVYCGTGEGNFWSFLGAGILRSSDGGASWITLCTNPFVGQGFFDLHVDGGNSKHLLTATTIGVHVSTDGGTTWQQTRSAKTWSLSMNLSGAKNAEILAASSDGIFESTDGGTTWTAVALPGSPGSFSRVAVSIAPSNPTVAYVWGANGASAYLWRRSGGAWSAVGTPPGTSTSQAWYDWYVSASPDRDTEVYCGAIEAYRGDLSGTAWTWLTISDKGSTGSSIHPDQHAIAFEPGNPNTIYAGCDGGLFRSSDRGVTWQSLNFGLVISEFEFLGQNPGSSFAIIGGLQDNGTARWSGNPAWDHVADGDGGYCGYNRANPLILAHTFYNMSPEVSKTGGDFGSWSFLPPTIPKNEGSLFYPPMRLSATTGDTVALGGGALYITRNDLSAWTRLAFPSSATASAVAIPDGDNVYVGTTDGRIFLTTWGGSAWGALTALTTPRDSAFVSDIYVDPTNHKRMWATYSTFGGSTVFRSDDAGRQWTDCTTGLPALPINSVCVDTRNASRIWVAADLGVYQSIDSGAHWSAFSNGLPNALIGDLIFHPHAWVLRAATRNRGVWEIPVDGWMTEPATGVQFTEALTAKQTKSWFTFNWPATWHVVWTVMPTSFAAIPQLSWVVRVQRASAEFVTYWIEVTNLTSAEVTFEGRFAILSPY